jgi:CDGSH-type Zn-finger protein
MNEENVMRMPAVQKRNDHEYAMKKTFISGALAGPGLSRSRLHCDGCITVHICSGPDAFDAAAEINPNA